MSCIVCPAAVVANKVIAVNSAGKALSDAVALVGSLFASHTSEFTTEQHPQPLSNKMSAAVYPSSKPLCNWCSSQQHLMGISQ